jgi:hypothetical protein
MTRPASALLLVAFSLLASAVAVTAPAATAYAECAWVLWSHTVPLSKAEKWKPETGFPDALSCQHTMTAIRPERLSIEAGGPEIERVDAGGNAATVYYKDGRKSSASLHCLPDTVDPRGPKGGGR